MTEPVAGLNKVVSIIYMIRDESGTISEYRDLPVTYIHGAQNDLFPAIEAALDGRPVGYKATVELAPDDAFGPHDPALIFTDDLDNTPAELRYVGAELEAQNERGEVRQFRVTEIQDGKLTVDANHPYAGKRLAYEVTITQIRDATPEELASGEAAPDLSSLQGSHDN